MNFGTIYDRLTSRRYKLAAQTDIKDMALYSRQWRALMLGYRFLGYSCMAGICESNWKRYGAMCGSYVRTLYPSHAVLEAV